MKYKQLGDTNINASVIGFGKIILKKQYTLIVWPSSNWV